MSDPAVTVLMAMYNAAAHLRAAVASVLAQTFADFELVVVDDGSMDESAAIVESFADLATRSDLQKPDQSRSSCRQNHTSGRNVSACWLLSWH